VDICTKLEDENLSKKFWPKWSFIKSIPGRFELFFPQQQRMQECLEKLAVAGHDIDNVVLRH
jgi:hypothetical protein